MRYSLWCAAAAAAGLLVPVWARADVLLYSFEGGSHPAVAPDNFVPNGGGAISQDTIGATDATHSMHDALGNGDTFVGALTQNPLDPIVVSPLTDRITMDVTMPVAYGGTNAAMGITIFAFEDPDGIPGNGDETNFGTPFQTANSADVDLLALGAGTHSVSIPLIEFFSNGPFYPFFSHDGAAGHDWDMGGFQIFFSKDNSAPLDVYIDNVRAVPEPGTILGVSAAGAALLLSRRRRSIA